MNSVVYMIGAGDSNPQRYELIKHETDSVYGSGRPGWGVQFKSAPSRRLISDEWRWFEDSAEQRDAFVDGLVAKYGIKRFEPQERDDGRVFLKRISV